jgi:hypothetical protein
MSELSILEHLHRLASEPGFRATIVNVRNCVQPWCTHRFLVSSCPLVINCLVLPVSPLTPFLFCVWSVLRDLSMVGTGPRVSSRTCSFSRQCRPGSDQQGRSGMHQPFPRLTASLPSTDSLPPSCYFELKCVRCKRGSISGILVIVKQQIGMHICAFILAGCILGSWLRVPCRLHLCTTAKQPPHPFAHIHIHIHI